MGSGRRRFDKKNPAGEFAVPPWDETQSEWQALDQRMPEQPVAREIAQGVEQVDLSAVYAT
jgi:hypothetical protein